jgi:DNA-binding GntR family transcriptional regulator
VSEQGHTPRQEVSVSIDMLTPSIAERLHLDREQDMVVVRRRVRYVDDMPFQLTDNYFPEPLSGEPSSCCRKTFPHPVDYLRQSGSRRPGS